MSISMPAWTSAPTWHAAACGLRWQPFDQRLARSEDPVLIRVIGQLGKQHGLADDQVEHRLARTASSSLSRRKIRTGVSSGGSSSPSGIGARIRTDSPYPHTLVAAMIDGAAKYLPDVQLRPLHLRGAQLALCPRRSQNGRRRDRQPAAADVPILRIEPENTQWHHVETS
jgi:hypothetical protein